MARLESWINGDESAKEMLARVSTAERPFVLLPPLHRVPLRIGNVVEISGPSPSAKTDILIQAAISCILPKEWNGVHYGGLESLVFYFDLDCRFDIQRLSQCLNYHILQANGVCTKNNLTPNRYPQRQDTEMSSTADLHEELFLACMRRFLYVRCYSSVDFLATLKTACYQLQKECKAHGIAACFLMIDSIGAFYWVDRASTSFLLGNGKRSMSIHCVVETVVQEIHKLLQLQPMLVLATKATLQGKSGRWPSQGTSNPRALNDPQKHSYREYMPSTWQSLVTHRMLVHVSDGNHHSSKHQYPTFVSEWLLPPLGFFDKFRVSDGGIFVVK